MTNTFGGAAPPLSVPRIEPSPVRERTAARVTFVTSTTMPSRLDTYDWKRLYVPCRFNFSFARLRNS